MLYVVERPSIEECFSLANSLVLVVLRYESPHGYINVSWSQPRDGSVVLFEKVAMSEGWTMGVTRLRAFRSRISCKMRLTCDRADGEFKNPLISETIYTEGGAYLTYEEDEPVLYADCGCNYEMARGFWL